jgi:hypothetical protein
MRRPFVVAAVLFAAGSAWGSAETPFPKGVVIDRRTFAAKRPDASLSPAR